VSVVMVASLASFNQLHSRQLHALCCGESPMHERHCLPQSLRVGAGVLLTASLDFLASRSWVEVAIRHLEFVGIEKKKP